MEYINRNLDRVSPIQFLAWFSVGAIFWLLSSLLGFSTDYIFANATYINITYGTVISTLIMLLSCMLLPFDCVKEGFFKKAYAISKLFSDTAMGASGFIAIACIHNHLYKEVAFLTIGIIIYTLTGNHIFHSIFNETKGTRKYFRAIDASSGTRLGTGLIERDIEGKVLCFASVIISLVFVGLLFIFHTIKI